MTARSAGEYLLHETVRQTARVNWHRVVELSVIAVAVSLAVAVIALGIIDGVTQ